MPCKRTSFDINLNLYHKNSVIDPFDEFHYNSRDIFMLRFYYDSINVEERVVTLVYDLSSFLAAAGGNIGLALGFSCLSLLLSSIRLITEWMAK